MLGIPCAPPLLFLNISQLLKLFVGEKKKPIVPVGLAESRYELHVNIAIHIPPPRPLPKNTTSYANSAQVALYPN